MKNEQAKDAELDLIATDWCEEEGFEKILVRFRIKEVTTRMRGTTLLDIGCGIGNVCRAVARQMRRVVGVDGSQRKIRWPGK